MPEREYRTPQPNGDHMARNLARFKKTIDRLESTVGKRMDEQAARARNMGDFFAEARTRLDFDIFELGQTLGIPMSEVRMMELGGLVETREELWAGPTPRNYARAIGEPNLYDRFCEQFGIKPYEDPESPEIVGVIETTLEQK